MDGAAFTDGNGLEFSPHLRFEAGGGPVAKNGDVPADQGDSIWRNFSEISHGGIRWLVCRGLRSSYAILQKL